MVIKTESKNLEMQQRARKRIPGGCQLLSKRPEMFAPEQWPGYYSKAQGNEIWDLDGNKYIDMSISGIGANILGYADIDVDTAVKKAIDSGSSSTFNCPEEVELADLLCEIHPWADMVRYTRCGGESMAVAVRIARAHTGREKIAFCGYHGWHDWYLSANLADDSTLEEHLLPGLDPAGVPSGLKGTMLPFRYNHNEDLEKIIQGHGKDIAAIVMEPIRSEQPRNGFLQKAKEFAAQIGAVFIFDEITSAWRLNSGGAHLLFGINPDIAVFAKAISNGYPMGVILGSASVMESAQKTFISSTSWTERIGPVAALATIRKHQKHNVAARLIEIGRRVQENWLAAAKQSGLKIHVSGLEPLSHFSFIEEDAQAIMTLYTQMMLERGFLASGRFYANYAQTDQQLESFLETVIEIFNASAQAKEQDKIYDLLKGPVAHSGFKRLN